MSSPSVRPAVVADRLIARHRAEADGSTYDGTGLCFIEFGDDRIGRVEVTFRNGEPPVGTFNEPSQELRAKKADFGASRAKRWFGREWANH